MYPTSWIFALPRPMQLLTEGHKLVGELSRQEVAGRTGARNLATGRCSSMQLESITSDRPKFSTLMGCYVNKLAVACNRRVADEMLLVCCCLSRAEADDEVVAGAWHFNVRLFWCNNSLPLTCSLRQYAYIYRITQHTRQRRNGAEMSRSWCKSLRARMNGV